MQILKSSLGALQRQVQQIPFQFNPCLLVETLSECDKKGQKGALESHSRQTAESSQVSLTPGINFQCFTATLHFQTSLKCPDEPVLPHDAPMSNMKLILWQRCFACLLSDSSQKILKMDAKWNLFDTAWPVMHRGMKESLYALVHKAASLLGTSKRFQPQGYN